MSHTQFQKRRKTRKIFLVPFFFLLSLSRQSDFHFFPFSYSITRTTQHIFQELSVYVISLCYTTHSQIKIIWNVCVCVGVYSVKKTFFFLFCQIAHELNLLSYVMLNEKTLAINAFEQSLCNHLGWYMLTPSM